MQLFALANRHMEWLAQRQAVTAQNIANLDTPGYAAKAISPFEDLVAQAGSTLTRTDQAHFGETSHAASFVRQRIAGGWDESRSGNSVSLEQELMTASQTSRMMNVDAAVLRNFHQMLLSSVRT